VSEPSQAQEQDGRSTRARQKSEATRRRILEAAMKLFARQGYNATSIDDVARASGIGRATVYLHFRGKAEILKTLTDDMLGKINAVLGPIDPELADKDEREQIVQLLDDLISVQEANPQLAELILHGSTSEEIDANLLGFYQALNTLIEDGLRMEIAAQRIRKLDTRVGARCILGVLKEVLIHPMARGEFGATQARERAIHMVDFLYYGVRLPPELRKPRSVQAVHRTPGERP
jgi:AcrR family transcriptional regulator